MNLKDLKSGDFILVKTKNCSDGFTLDNDYPFVMWWLYQIHLNMPDKSLIDVIVPFDKYKWENKRFHSDVFIEPKYRKVVSYQECKIFNGKVCSRCKLVCQQQCFFKLKYL